jgi:hypothetical protein
MEHDAEFLARVHDRRVARMDAVDQMAPELRACVHDFGLNVVRQFTNLGVTKPAHIRHLVNAVLDEFSPTRGSFSIQGTATPLNRVEKANG